MLCPWQYAGHYAPNLCTTRNQELIVSLALALQSSKVCLHQMYTSLLVDSIHGQHACISCDCHCMCTAIMDSMLVSDAIVAQCKCVQHSWRPCWHQMGLLLTANVSAARCQTRHHQRTMVAMVQAKRTRSISSVCIAVTI